MTFILVHKKKKKYPNKWTACRQGHRHQSKYEARYCDTLALLVKAGEIENYETQIKYALRANNKHIAFYKADFLVRPKNGLPEVHETKGHWTKEAKLKRKLFEACYPHIKFIVIKQKEWGKKRWGSTNNLKNRKRLSAKHKSPAVI